MLARVISPFGTVPTWSLAVAVFVTAGLAGFIVVAMLRTKWITPLRSLASAAEAMSRGDWARRVEPEGADDLKAFAEQFNLVAAQAQRQLAALDHQRADLQALVDSLPDPILLIDGRRRIALINQPAAKLLQLPRGEALGRPIDLTLNEELLLALVEEAADREDGAHREVRVNRNGKLKTYQAAAMPGKSGGMLVVLRNITTLATAVQMKTDFVANASHELRTPIAAIKIAFETLREARQDDPQQADRCVEIINGHLKRLEDMLADLLDLSRVESPDSKPQLASVGIQELFANVRVTQGNTATAKHVDLVFQQTDETMSDDGLQADLTLVTDRRLIDLVLKNLVENALKFTPAGGRVTVAATRRADDADPGKRELVLAVADTGIGIPPEHAERVFERFYQVNSARSGTSGRGTGLGLAIVKHAIHALGGTVALTSVVGRGTTVTCRIPTPYERPTSDFLSQGN